MCKRKLPPVLCNACAGGGSGGVDRQCQSSTPGRQCRRRLWRSRCACVCYDRVAVCVICACPDSNWASAGLEGPFCNSLQLCVPLEQLAVGIHCHTCTNIARDLGLVTLWGQIGVVHDNGIHVRVVYFLPWQKVPTGCIVMPRWWQRQRRRGVTWGFCWGVITDVSRCFVWWATVSKCMTGTR